MKIRLIYPYCLEDRIHQEDVNTVPLGLYYIAALLLSHGHDVAILNAQPLKQHPERIRDWLADEKPDLIGLSVFSANRWGAIDLARMAKALRPDTVTVFGGIGASALWAFFLTHFSEVDAVVCGEGEYPLLNLVRALESGRTWEEIAIPGVAVRRNRTPQLTPPDGLIPDLDQLPDPSIYFTFQHVALTRGCPSHCTFCGSPDFWGRRVRSHSPGYFVHQIERLYRKKVRFFHVSDDTFTYERERVIEICREIIGRGMDIAWTAISRVDCVDQEMMTWMRRAGCVQISFGVESGSADIRRFFNKGFSEDQVRRAFSLCSGCGILTRAYFIYGAPGESEETIGETLRLIDIIQPLSAIFYILAVFPGTALYRYFKKRFRVDDRIWFERIEDILWCEYDPGLGPEKVMAFGKELRQGYSGRLADFARDLTLIDQPDLYPLHADFLSRLGMTFLKGEYAGNPHISDADAAAEALMRRSLGYHPDPRAFLGLAMIAQKRMRFIESAETLAEGLRQFPGNPELNICRAVSLMNLNRHHEARDHLAAFPRHPQAQRLMAECRRILGDQPASPL